MEKLEKIYSLFRKHEVNNLQAQLLETTKEHNRTVSDARRLTQLLSKSQAENKILKSNFNASNKEVVDLKDQLKSERETAFKVMGSMQQRIDGLEQLKERNEMEISGLQMANRQAAEQNQEQNQVIRKQLVGYAQNLDNTAAVFKTDTGRMNKNQVIIALQKQLVKYAENLDNTAAVFKTDTGRIRQY